VTPRTHFSETEALLCALDDTDADSGNTEATDVYLRKHFSLSELERLERAASLLRERTAATIREWPR
jgi:hypothetical protein